MHKGTWGIIQMLHRKAMETYGKLWKAKGSNGRLWKATGSNGKQWIAMGVNVLYGMDSVQVTASLVL